MRTYLHNFVIRASLFLLNKISKVKGIDVKWYGVNHKTGAINPNSVNCKPGMIGAYWMLD